MPYKDKDKKRENAKLWARNNPEKRKAWNDKNPESHKKSQRKWAQNNPDKIKEKNKRYSSSEPDKKSKLRALRRYKNLTPERYDELLQMPCETCGSTEGRMCIDHCHETDIIRGRLCAECNSALGLLKESPRISIKMYNYIINRCNKEYKNGSRNCL